MTVHIKSNSRIEQNLDGLQLKNDSLNPNHFVSSTGDTTEGFHVKMSKALSTRGDKDMRFPIDGLETFFRHCPE